MQRLHAFINKIRAQFGAHRRGEQIMAVIADRTVKGLIEPVRDACTAACRKAPRLGPVGDRQDSRGDGRGDPRIGAGIAKAQEGIRLEKELRDRP